MALDIYHAFRISQHIHKLSFLATFLSFMLIITSTKPLNSEVNEKSPYHQHLPDCQDISKSIEPFPVKVTKEKGIICPMIKDEEGFLSEFVAYYEMHGFDRVVFYDNNSTQPSLFDEIKPWIRSGFVTIEREWWVNITLTPLVLGLPIDFFVKPTDLLNQLAGFHCKQKAIEEGYDIFLTVDIDEYLVPRNNYTTVIDDIVNWMDYQKKNIIFLSKLNFSPVPHIHEPINLLTIEAYQTRYPIPQKMSYYITTATKIAIRLRHSSYTENTTKGILHCCHFHGCDFNSSVFTINHVDCGPLVSEHRVIWPKPRKGSKIEWQEPPMIHHYARSLEKFAMKQSTYASLASGNESFGNGQGLSVFNFMNRAYGHKFDDSALDWSCRLRRWLREKTGVQHFLRAGLNWYRNPEFGRVVRDPQKRGRHGNGYRKRLRKIEVSPYPPGETYQAARGGGEGG